ncbi:DNA ligase [Caulobacter phage Lullwater]|uniref:DNA ligase n=1 Tax=Caulobacter phage Lullwater TaxID=2024607 RepID=A0A291LB33_9CAUD|nr:DNA ligase [Caulobacter phage Lullwater]ATI16334.1 DNA ligase [Caulobacter phage Lullwater]
MSKDYIVQKAVAPEKVVKPNRKSLEYMGENYEAQTKNDGCCAVIKLNAPSTWVEATVEVRSRTDEACLSMSAQANKLWFDFRDKIEEHNGLVIIAEAWWPGNNQFAEISGAFRKKSEQRPRLKFIVNDILTLEEFNRGETDTPYHARMGRSEGIQPSGNAWEFTQRWAPGSYGDPRDLCAELVDRGGYDGLILRDPQAGWKRGSGTHGGIIKLKRELSFDLRVLRVLTSTGEKTGRAVYTLEVSYKGRVLRVGSGLPHDAASLPKVGDIVEVCAMDYSSDGLLREPRYKGIRYDKLEPDA